MINVDFKGILLEKTDLPFENVGVLNPTCIHKDGLTHMFYRAVTGNNLSSIGYCQIDKDKVLSRATESVLVPEFDYERHGVEDPRIVELEGTYYLFYTAYDGVNALTALATSIDLKHFEKQGLITPSIKYSEAREIFASPNLSPRYEWYAKHYEESISPIVMLWGKDLVLFPEKINNQYFLLTRVMPGIQCMLLDNLDQLKDENFWRTHLKDLDKRVVMDPKFWYETRKIGASCVPIKTEKGWIQIYHGVEDSPAGNIYRASVALLDLNNPQKVIGRLAEPLISPEQEWEKVGIASNVIFPSGAAIHGDELYIYYGAADSRIAVASVKTDELLNELLKSA